MNWLRVDFSKFSKLNLKSALCVNGITERTRIEDILTHSPVNFQNNSSQREIKCYSYHPSVFKEPLLIAMLWAGWISTPHPAHYAWLDKTVSKTPLVH